MISLPLHRLGDEDLLIYISLPQRLAGVQVLSHPLQVGPIGTHLPPDGPRLWRHLPVLPGSACPVGTAGVEYGVHRPVCRRRMVAAQKQTQTNHMKKIISIFAVTALVAACARPQEFHVSPMPADVTVSDGSFCVKGAAVQVDDSLDEASKAAVARFVEALETATGAKTKVGEGGFRFLYNPNLAAEQYSIEIGAEGAVVEASALNGFVYACETLQPVSLAAGRSA